MKPHNYSEELTTWV